MKLPRIRIAIALATLVVTSSGCGLINRIRAKNELNEAASAYRDAHFEEAERRSRRALALDPTNKTAPLFIARIVHRQFKKGVNTPENLAKARDAIELYKKIIQTDPKNEEAFKAIADLYGALNEDDKQREWILQRATDKENIDDAKRAEAYIILATKDWHCSNDITELPANKTTIVDPKTNQGTPSYRKPKEGKDFEAVKLCVTRGLEEIEKAIQIVPNSEPAWAVKTSLLLEASKRAEMEGKMDEKARLDKQEKDAQQHTNDLSEANRKKKEEEEAKKAATPPAG
jgi:tetratricopeptide (TPR) repeat protein